MAEPAQQHPFRWMLLTTSTTRAAPQTSARPAPAPRPQRGAPETSGPGHGYEQRVPQRGRRNARSCRVALVPKELAVRASVHGRQGGARRAGSGSWTRSARLPVGSAIHPSVRAAPSWSAVGVVVSPRAAARALSAAMTASRAWSGGRQAGSWSPRRSQDAAAVRVSTSWWRTVVFAAGAVGLIVR
jgi:hypothetical protein